MSDQNQDNAEIEETNHALQMGEDLKVLKNMPEFKRVILNGYLEQKALASVSLLGVPQERPRRVEIYEDLIACSNLQFFFAMIEDFYEGAKNPVLSDDEQAELEEMQAEAGA